MTTTGILHTHTDKMAIQGPALETCLNLAIDLILQLNIDFFFKFIIFFNYKL